jgi:signal transduction histidine kinase
VEDDREKTEFVSLASHQLRNPLSELGWNVEAFLGGNYGALTERQREALEEMNVSKHNMVELVDDLLNVSRIELGALKLELKPTDIVAFVHALKDENKRSAEAKHIRFVLECAIDALTLETDPRLLRMALQNVLSNAVKYTPEGGTVTLAVREDGARRELQCIVSDTGYGIPAKARVHLFEKFYRAENVREKNIEGTGLGLYIAKSALSRMGGIIVFESEEGKGTRFVITLPSRNTVDMLV